MPASRRDFPPEARSDAHQEVLDEILECINPTRRSRSNPRVIKRKMSNWPVKRAHHYNAHDPIPSDIHII